MTGLEIEGIIQACARANVRAINIAGMHLEFGEAGQKPATTPPAVPEPTRAAGTTLPDEEHEKQTRRAIALEEMRLRQDQLDLMQIENPFLFEQLLLSGELEDAPGERDV